jgi:hypothetical protein
MKLYALLALAVTTSTFASTPFFEGWKGFSDPAVLSSGFNHRFEELPLSGSIEDGKKGWSSTYWPSNKGGIANRWNTADKDLYKYTFSSPTREQVLTMSEDQLARLSPAEKYDLLLGNYNYSFRNEALASTSPSAKSWAGICQGWAAAATLHNEPTPKTLLNPDGVKIPFGSADIKGLLSYVYAFYADEEYVGQMGQRCYFGSWLGGVKGCGEDLNAGAFHIVLANKLGLEKKGFIIDRDRHNEVWNQPVANYTSTIVSVGRPSSDAAKTAVSEVRVKTVLFYVDESDPTWAPVHGTSEQKLAKMDLEYTIELNYQGKIVGGEWISYDRPDYIWNKNKVEKFGGQFARLPELLND